MIKIFETGDLHIGKKYDRFPEVKEKLINSRFECLERMVKEADRRECAVFVVTGDTFDSVNNVNKIDVERVAEILSRFSGRVLVLPGNHDYYNEEAKVWKYFFNAMDKTDNITVLKEFSPVAVELNGEKTVFYPAFCQSKHSEKNNIDWIKNCEIDSSVYNIGIAHGALSGITPDMNGEYFLMTEHELEAVPMDIWLIGHTHIQYPKLEPGKILKGYKVYNAGTPEQLDLHNDTDGLSFIITLDKSEGHKEITAETYRCGNVNYKDLDKNVKAGDGTLKEKLLGFCEDTNNMTVMRLRLKGTVTKEDFDIRKQLYQQVLSNLMTFEVEDDELRPQITMEQVKAEFPEFGFAAGVLEKLSDDPVEMQMAYDLLKECRE